jgi:hypothetical protein
MTTRSQRRRTRAQRGGTIVETLVALPVVVFFFGGIVQVGALEAAALSTRHAAHAAARSAAVAAADDPRFFGGEQVGSLTGQRRAMVQATAQAALGLSTQQPAFELAFAQDHLSDGDDVNVTVTFEFPCVIPIGRFVCGLSGTKRIVESARYPYQAASYDYP